MINTIAPHWDGNQVWLITAGGAIFAAWPTVYATAFSGFYVAMVLTLMALFFRPVGFDYRSKIEDPRWRSTWDWCLFIGGAVPPIVFGVAFGNLLQGVPFTLDTFLRSSYEGNFFGLLNPFGLLAGIISLLMVLSQGAAWLMLKSDGAVLARARGVASVTGLLTAILFAAGGYWIAQFRFDILPDIQHILLCQRRNLYLRHISPQQCLFHIVQCEPTFFLPGSNATGQFGQQFDHCLAFLVLLNIHHGITTAAVFGQENRFSGRNIPQDFIVIAQIRDWFDIRHGEHHPFCHLV